MEVAQTRTKQAAVGVSFASRKPRSLWTDAWYRLLRNKLAIFGMGMIAAMMLTAILADVLAPHDPNKVWDKFALNEPVWITGDDRFLLGNDGIGRDIVSRLIYGARISMFVGIIPVTLYLLIGGSIGMIAGYYGGRVDNLLMRLTDVVFAFPSLLLLLLFVATFRDTWIANQAGGLLLIFAGLALVGWEGYARLIRGQVLSVKQKEYIEAARCIGVPTPQIMYRHIFPNVLAPLLISIAFGVPGAIFAEASLSFLGLGVRPPIATWGSMINEGYQSLSSHPTMVLAPAALIALVLLSFSFLGDGLRDALDPRMKN